MEGGRPGALAALLRVLDPPTTFGEEGGSTPDPVVRRLEKYPTLRFKLDPENDWDEDLIGELSEIANVDILDLKGLYRGTPVDVETDPVLYRNVSSAFPDAYLEDPDINDETRPVLDMDRVTWDAPLESLADIERLEHKPPAINSKPSRFGSLRSSCRSTSTAIGRKSPSTAAARASSASGAADPVPRLALPPRDSERRGALGLQRPERPGRPRRRARSSPAGGSRLPLGRVGALPYFDVARFPTGGPMADHRSPQP